MEKKIAHFRLLCLLTITIMWQLEKKPTNATTNIEIEINIKSTFKWNGNSICSILVKILTFTISLSSTAKLRPCSIQSHGCWKWNTVELKILFNAAFSIFTCNADFWITGHFWNFSSETIYSGWQKRRWPLKLEIKQRSSISDPNW